MQVPSASGRNRTVPKRDTHKWAAEVGCMACGAGRWAGGLVVCERCRRDLAPTRVQRALAALEMTIDALAEATGVSRRTCARAVAGFHLARRLATKVSRVTGVPVDALMVDEPAPMALRRVA